MLVTQPMGSLPVDESVVTVGESAEEEDLRRHAADEQLRAGRYR